MDPFSAGVFTSIGSAFKFADVAIRIAEVGSENAVFVRTICVVRSDLEEVERLLSEDTVQKKLTATPGKLPWIKTAIHNTRYALNEIGRWVERVRVEQESTGSIRFDTRVRWVFSDHEKLLSRKTELSTCHQQLSSILGYLVGLEVAPGHPAPQEYEDTTQFEDVLARHRRTNRPKPPKADSGQKSIAVKKGVLHDHAAANPVPNTYSRLPPVSGHRSPSNAALFNVHERDDSIRSPSFASSRKPTGSPPPTYATAVSVDSVTYDVRPSLYSPPMADKSTSADQGTDHKDTLNRPHNETWAYRSNLNDMAISELAGDAVVFSATNSAGPVNPYELCVNPGTATSYNNESSQRPGESSQRPGESLSELLSDLSFPAQHPRDDPGPPLGYPPRLRAAFDQVGMCRTSHFQLRNRTMSETTHVVQRRPFPTNALSDSLVTVHELPPSLALYNNQMPVPSTVRSSNTHHLATKRSSDDPYHPKNNQRPSSYSAHQSHWSTQSPINAPNRHYSAPMPALVSHADYAASFSAESTSSWGLDTQPKAPITPRAQEPAMVTRMQSQKRMMDLLGSIGS